MSIYWLFKLLVAILAADLHSALCFLSVHVSNFFFNLRLCVEITSEKSGGAVLFKHPINWKKHSCIIVNNFLNAAAGDKNWNAVRATWKPQWLLCFCCFGNAGNLTNSRVWWHLGVVLTHTLIPLLVLTTAGKLLPSCETKSASSDSEFWIRVVAIKTKNKMSVWRRLWNGTCPLLLSASV